MKNKKVVLWLVGFVIFLGVVYLGYNELSSKYEKENKKAEEELINNGQNNGLDNIKDNLEVSKDIKKEAIDFTVYDDKKNQVKLSDYIGTPIVLNFWASWCPPCKAEMPYFQKISDEYEEDKLIVLMLNLTDGQKETMDSAKKFMEKSGYKMTTLFDMDFDASKKYGISGIPRTILIDKDGYIIYDKIGMVTETYLSEMVEKLVDNK